MSGILKIAAPMQVTKEVNAGLDDVIKYSVNNREIQFPNDQAMEKLAVDFFEKDIAKMLQDDIIQNFEQLLCFGFFMVRCSNEYMNILFDTILEDEEKESVIYVKR